MSVRLAGRGVSLILLDIEGTTTPITFVVETLFPYARRHVRGFLGQADSDADVRDALDLLAREHAVDLANGEPLGLFPVNPDLRLSADGEAVASYVGWLMDRDRKSPGLKLLQGRIWERGYQAGELGGEVFADVPVAFRAWRAAGIDIAIYSSGSVLAQRRLFQSTEHGDLTPFISSFYDPAVGAKRDPESYLRIAADLGRLPASLLFLSDIGAELVSARLAGLQAVLVIRPGNPPQSSAAGIDSIQTFADIVLA